MERVFRRVSMRYRMLLIMTLAQLCAAVVQQGFGSLAPFVVSFFHVNKAQLGLAFSSLMLGSAVMVAVSGVGVDRFGERAVTVTSGIGIFTTLCLAAAYPSYPWLVVSLFLMGMTYAACSPAGGRAILSWFHRDRAFAMSIRQTGVPAGAVVGGLVLPAIAFHFDYRLALVCGGLFALIGTAGLGFFYRDPRDAPPSGHASSIFGGIKLFLRDPRALLCTLTAAGLNAAQQITAGFISLSAIVLGHLSIATAAAVFSTVMAAAMVGRISWGWTSDVIFRGDRSLPIAITSFIAAAAGLGVAFIAPGNAPLVFACAFFLGFAGSGWNGLYAATLAEVGGLRFAGSALGLGGTVNFAAGALGPFLFGAFADAHGLARAWVAFAVGLALLAVPAIFARRAQARFGGALEPQAAANG